MVRFYSLYYSVLLCLKIVGRVIVFLGFLKSDLRVRVFLVLVWGGYDVDNVKVWFYFGYVVVRDVEYDGY